MLFPVVICECESWTIKKAEHRRIDAFELQCWRRLLSPLDSKEINAVNPKGNKPWTFIRRTVAEGEAPILWHLMQRTDSLEKTVILGKSEGRRRGWQKMKFLDGITNPKDMSLSKLWGLVMDRKVHGGQGVRQDWAAKLNWTALILLSIYQCSYQKSNFKKNARWLLLLFPIFFYPDFCLKEH